MTAAVSRETDRGGHGRVSRETPSSAKPGIGARLVLLPIRFYRRFISPALGARCRYYPSCSAYAEEAVREVGPIKGMILAAWRLLRCNPFSNGGLDPVSERPFFRPDKADNERPEEPA